MNYLPFKLQHIHHSSSSSAPANGEGISRWSTEESLAAAIAPSSSEGGGGGGGGGMGASGTQTPKKPKRNR